MIYFKCCTQPPGGDAGLFKLYFWSGYQPLALLLFALVSRRSLVPGLAFLFVPPGVNTGVLANESIALAAAAGFIGAGGGDGVREGGGMGGRGGGEFPPPPPPPPPEVEDPNGNLRLELGGLGCGCFGFLPSRPV